ncbi:HAMP domain-containing sensor histidine kinase [Sulfitobacter sp. HNIBRBA3233]|uniref:sensor histidine kinase n=1 Tax=Sulfitobacter marinivivus TaxID=3158558 RepID=UPI0032DED163
MMIGPNGIINPWRHPPDLDTLVTQINDYCAVGRALVVQRTLIFMAALVLQAVYISTTNAGICLVLILIAELFDFKTFRMARLMDRTDPKQVRSILRRIHFGTLLSSGVISFFAISISVMQTESNYFMPLFFLLAAAIFAAMNNHQIVSVLVIRIGIYGATFIFIPMWDLVLSGAGLSDPMWLNFFTSLFVLYFIIDCSMTALKYYRTSKRHLKQLRFENERARAALVAKTEFLSTVSHELRTPLTSIKASLDMTMAGAFGPVPEKSEAVLKIAQRNAGRLSQLINELLDLQRMEIGKMNFNFAPVEIASLLADALADNRCFADELGVKLALTPVEAGLTVNGDRMRLEQVVTNLLSNAAKFSDSGKEIHLSARKCGDNRVQIAVRDQGFGINESDRDRIFESFTQLDASDRRKVGGTGLGLNITKRLVEAHGGDIDFTRNSDGGTTFFVTLDLIEDQPKPVDTSKKNMAANSPLSPVRRAVR